MIFNFSGSGGGGAGLNVVTGLSAPVNPKENTVWVASDKAGKKYVFSETEPESPSEGLIWFLASSAGAVTQANVYTDGAWVTTNAYMYLAGSWVQITAAQIHLTNGADRCDGVTGGWSAIRWWWNSTAYGSVPKVAWADDGVTLTVPGTPGPGGLIITKNTIDLTRIKRITIECANVNANSWCIVSTATGDNFNANEVARVQLDNGTNVLDVSSLSGACYIGLVAYHQAKVTVKQTYME